MLSQHNDEERPRGDQIQIGVANEQCVVPPRRSVACVGRASGTGGFLISSAIFLMLEEQIAFLDSLRQPTVPANHCMANVLEERESFGQGRHDNERKG